MQMRRAKAVILKKSVYVKFIGHVHLSWSMSISIRSELNHGTICAVQIRSELNKKILGVVGSCYESWNFNIQPIKLNFFFTCL